MEFISKNFEKRPLLWFFVLTFLISPLLLLTPGVISLLINAPVWLASFGEILVSWAPNIAAFIIVGSLSGLTGIKNLFSQFLKWKVHPKWYLFAVLVPILIAYLAAFAYVTVAGKPTYAFLSGISFVSFLSLIIKHVIRGPLGEEAGWRGFALPLLLKKYSLTKASFLLGLVWSLWHFPFWAMVVNSTFPNSPQSMIVMFISLAIGVVALSIVIGWLYVKTQSLFLTMLFHLFWNVAHELIIVPWDSKFFLITTLYVVISISLYFLLKTNKKHKKASTY